MTAVAASVTVGGAKEAETGVVVRLKWVGSLLGGVLWRWNGAVSDCFRIGRLKVAGRNERERNCRESRENGSEYAIYLSFGVFSLIGNGFVRPKEAVEESIVEDLIASLFNLNLGGFTNSKLYAF